MSLEETWDKLDQPTRRWITTNRGCRVLPRTVAGAVRRAAGHPEIDTQHGQMELTPEDLRFIARKSDEAAGQQLAAPLNPPLTQG
ncbi:hypothetical protein D6T65_12835 [Arthrobacter frigidicola]|nr:hypothetical protein D6T65_12835 [Arthrobacter frigidicola]